MTLIQSSGQIEAIAPPDRPMIPPGSVSLFEDRWADYAAIYRTQPQVRRVISF